MEVRCQSICLMVLPLPITSAGSVPSCDRIPDLGVWETTNPRMNGLSKSNYSPVRLKFSNLIFSLQIGTEDILILASLDCFRK